MRGKGQIKEGVAIGNRITPAYAGKRKKNPTSERAAQDHPCICGEKSQILFYLLVLLGSPLHMRGKATKGKLFSLSLGITPAYAGKSDSYS